MKVGTKLFAQLKGFRSHIRMYVFINVYCITKRVTKSDYVSSGSTED